MMHCPDLAISKKTHQPLFACKPHLHGKSSKPTEQALKATPADSIKRNEGLMAATDMHFKIKMPSALAQQYQSDEEMNDMNKLLANYSNNKVMLQRNENGKVFLKAHSAKDIFLLAKNVSKPRGYYEKRYGNGGSRGGDGAGAAIASSILGPISFVFAFIPFLSLAAIPIGLAAIITGAIGLGSSRPRRAVVGLTFGILGLLLGILFSILYAIVFGIALL